jgi:hypothetical protein
MRAAEERDQVWRSRQDVLGVVEDQQHPPIAQRVAQLVKHRAISAVSQAKRGRDGRID